MPLFEYRGVAASGRTVKGARDWDGPESAKAALRREGIVPTEIREASAPGGAGGAVAAATPRHSFRQRARPADVSLATRQLATLSRAGIPLVEALSAVIEQTPRMELGRALVEVRNRVNEGESLADSMRRHGRIFPDYYVNMVNAGEQSGTLDMVLDRLADFYETQGRLRGKVQAALMYPIIMSILGTVIVGILMVVVVPKVAGIFRDFGKQLPWYTDALIAVSSLVVDWWWAMVVVLIVSILGFRAWRRSRSGRAAWDRIVLRLPVAGDLAMKIAIARFARTLGTLLRSSVPVLKAMDITRGVMGNVELERIVGEARTAVQEGESIAVTLKRSGRFDPIVTHMIAVGERSGQLEEMLLSVAGAYESQIDSRLAALTSLLEPILIVVMGGAAAGIAASILLPLLRLSEFVR